MIANYGGNKIKKLDYPVVENITFAQDAYLYEIYYLINGQKTEILNLNSYAIYLLDGIIEVNNQKMDQAGEALQVENEKAVVTCHSPATFLLVGTALSYTNKNSVIKTAYPDLKKVEKPWGYEIWITGEHPLYCLKKIFIKAGNKTSLQYHNHKRETNVLFEGQVELHFKKDSSLATNDLVATEDITKVLLSPISVIDVFPNTLHRLAAISDILLYEVSTPQLDDVIRVADDTQRANGRISKEHL